MLTQRLCASASKKRNTLDLSSLPALMVGGSGGKVAIPGDGASSKLYTVTTGTEEPVMPPKGDRIERKASDHVHQEAHRLDHRHGGLAQR